MPGHDENFCAAVRQISRAHALAQFPAHLTTRGAIDAAACLSARLRPLYIYGLIPSEHDPEKWVPVFGKDHAQ
jgi:hypothetical protein